jgi:SH3-like domain-containing protein
MRFVTAFVVFYITQVSAMCVLTRHVTMRKGPGMEHGPSAEVIIYTPLKKLEKKNGWYRVQDFENHKHWIREDLVTTHFECAVIKTEFATLRTGPGPRFPKARGGVGEKHLAFRLLESKKDWIRVEDAEGDEVWIAKKSVWID